MQKFTSIKYIGGLAEILYPQEVALSIDDDLRRIVVGNDKVVATVNFEEIQKVTIIDRSTKKDSTNVIESLSNDDIRLVTKAENRTTRSDTVLVCISHKKDAYSSNLLLKAKGQTRKIYAALTSSLSTEVPINFSYKRPPAEKEKLAKITTGAKVFVVILVLVLLLLIKICFI